MPASLLSWLASAELRAPDGPGAGHCLSWWNPRHPGYPYPEISGLLLHLLAVESAAPSRRGELVQALVRDPAPVEGVARDGQAYTFDTAMALGGLLADLTTAGTDEVARRWTDLLVTAADKRSPAAAQSWASALRPETRWSESYGAHQAKVVGALLAARDRFGDSARMRDAVDVCVAAATEVQEPDGRFRAHAFARQTYVHSHCYAVEGLLMAAADGGSTADQPDQGDLRDLRDRLWAGAAWLAAVQEASGGLVAWHDGRSASGPVRADATAQALRIWTLVDPDHFADSSARAAAALEALRVPGRGLRYEPDSDDVNAWSTIFGHQALSWHNDAAAASVASLV
ncbi:MAG: hypothetical protein ACJ71T_07525 [Actinomycetales bacterium]